jgi:twitching motility protein PilT
MGFVLDTFLQEMVELGASDLHLGTGVQPMLRLHGDIVPLEDYPAFEAGELEPLLKEITPEQNQREFEEDWDTDFAYELPDGRFRANLFRDHRGAGAVFRMIPTEVPTPQDLGLPPVVTELCMLSRGLVLVTGPTGSGKSTTLSAMVHHINATRKEHIVTIEDPIEFVHPNNRCLINQRQVGRHTKSFKKALRAALREDPDIVLIGEMRDLETIEIALETAETGHLVFGTLHTTTAAGTVDRIIDQFPADRQAQIRTMLSESLKGVIAQTLCRKIGTGRVAGLEILLVNPAIASNIREGKTHQIPSIMQVSSKIGMCLLNDSLMKLVRTGEISPLEAYLKAAEKKDIENKLAHEGFYAEIPTGDTPPPPPAPPAASSSPPPAAREPKTPTQEPRVSDPFEKFRRGRKP